MGILKTAVAERNLQHKRAFTLELLEKIANKKHPKLVTLEEDIYNYAIDESASLSADKSASLSADKSADKSDDKSEDEYKIVDIYTYNSTLLDVVKYFNIPVSDNEYVVDLYLHGNYKLTDIIGKHIPLYSIKMRYTYLSLFYAFLWNANEKYKCCEKDNVFYKAYLIELYCLKHAIEISKTTNNLHTLCVTWNTTFKSIYEERCAIIARSLDIDSDMYQYPCMALFIQSVLKGDIAALKVGKMSYQEICPDAYSAETKELETRSLQKIVEKTSRMFACPACKKRNITYREDQRRSLDEASGYACKCMDCGIEFYKR
jgi:DNA-directed RNA polymerase subunit M/transcription elongation factor TFIIS